MDGESNPIVRNSETVLMEKRTRDLLQLFLQYCSAAGLSLVDYLKMTQQSNGYPQPPIQLGYDISKPIFDLPKPQDIQVNLVDLRDAIENRRSIRSYSEHPMSLEELTWLLWCTQGVREIRRTETRIQTFRNVPSGGSLHPFETYILVNNVEGLQPGIYRYLAVEHKLTQLNTDTRLKEQITKHCGTQPWMNQAAAMFIWSFVPNRAVWRYGRGAHKLFFEVGHICQNLYLAAEAINSGVCAIGAFDLDGIHDTLEIEKDDQIVVYIAAVGKKKT